MKADDEMTEKMENDKRELSSSISALNTETQAIRKVLAARTESSVTELAEAIKTLQARVTALETSLASKADSSTVTALTRSGH